MIESQTHLVFPVGGGGQVTVCGGQLSDPGGQPSDGQVNTVHCIVSIESQGFDLNPPWTALIRSKDAILDF